MKKNEVRLQSGRLIYRILFFSFSPLLCTIHSMMQRRKEDFFILFLFTSWFAFLINPSNEGQDLYRHMENLQYVKFNSVIDVLKAYSQGEIVDLFLTILQVFVSQITNNPHVLLLIVGIILGFFYAAAINLFSRSRDRITIALIFIFSFIVGLDRLGGIRGILAFYIYFVSIGYYLKNAKKRFLLISPLALFVHFSAILYMLIFLLYLPLRNKTALLYYGVIVTFLISFFVVSLGTVFNFDFLGSAMSYQINQYTSGEMGMELAINKERLNWYVRFESTLMFFGQTIVVLLINRMDKYIVRYNRDLLSFVMMLVIFSNLLVSVPNLSEWITMYSFAFLVYYINTVIMLFKRKQQVMMVMLLLFFSSLHIAYTVRQIMFIINISDIVIPVFFKV